MCIRDRANLIQHLIIPGISFKGWWNEWVVFQHQQGGVTVLVGFFQEVKCFMQVLKIGSGEGEKCGGDITLQRFFFKLIHELSGFTEVPLDAERKYKRAQRKMMPVRKCQRGLISGYGFIVLA